MTTDAEGYITRYVRDSVGNMESLRKAIRAGVENDQVSGNERYNLGRRARR